MDVDAATEGERLRAKTRLREQADLWQCPRQDSNLRHLAPEASALSPELRGQGRPAGRGTGDSRSASATGDGPLYSFERRSAFLRIGDHERVQIARYECTREDCSSLVA